MKAFTELFIALDQTTKTNAKIDALVRYFEHNSDEDKLWCIALLSDKRPPRPLNTNVLRTIAANEAGIDLWLFEETYHVVGDLSETISLLVEQKYEHPERPLSAWMQEIASLKKREEQERIDYITHAWRGFDKENKFIFNKLIGGGFRMGVSSQIVIKALAKHTTIPAESIAHKLMGDWSPEKITFQELILEDNSKNNDAIPYPFYLAYPVESLDELGSVRDWIFERKWDGIRGQIIKRGDGVYVWSRGEDLVTDRFPEINGGYLQEKNFVLDGEILCHDETAPLPFALLQTRIGRKNVGKSTLTKAPVKFIAYDLLELDGLDLRDLPLVERKLKLAELLTELNHPNLIFSEVLEFENWQDAAVVRSRAREEYCEGLMIKHKESTYKVGRKRGEWWKWKLDALTIDAVMIYAMRGHGRRANLYTDFTFAVWQDNTLVPFAKAYSGLTDAEMKEVDAFVKKNTIDKFGPVRSVTPELVFEIAFEGIQKSTRHKSGIALRFPRIHRWRKDKTAHEANSHQDLLDLLHKYGA
jgi:DNA ligase-1